MHKRRLTGLYMFRRHSAAPEFRKTAVGAMPLCAVLLHPHLGRGSLLRNALLPAPNVIYSRNVMQQFCKSL
jgi:hypothetical protein